VKQFKQILKKAIMSGVYVTLVVTVYLMTLDATGNKLIGGILFSFALLMIVGRGYYLYTGKIGYFLPYEKGNAKIIGTTLLGNILGILITSSLILLAGQDHLTVFALEQVNLKFEGVKLYETFILAFFCGVFMFTAVDGYNNIDDKIIRVLVVMFSVVIFLLIGFEHSIANMVYLAFAKKFSFKYLITLIVMLLGNAAGAITLNFLHLKPKNK